MAQRVDGLSSGSSRGESEVRREENFVPRWRLFELRGERQTIANSARCAIQAPVSCIVRIKCQRGVEFEEAFVCLTPEVRRHARPYLDPGDIQDPPAMALIYRVCQGAVNHQGRGPWVVVPRYKHKEDVFLWVVTRRTFPKPPL